MRCGSLLAMSIALGCITPAWADDMETLAPALTQLRDHNYRQAIDMITPLAEAGNPTAEMMLGTIYGGGFGYKSANVADGFKWTKRAADHGLMEAQSSIGDAYYFGRGVEKNGAEAVKWYQRSAGQAFPPAQAALGMIYVLGTDVPQDFIQAYMWNLLAQQNAAVHPEIRSRLVDAVGPTLAQMREHMSAEEIAKAEGLAKQWKPEVGR